MPANSGLAQGAESEPSRPLRASNQDAVLVGWVVAIVRAIQAEGIPIGDIAEACELDVGLLQNGRNRYSQKEVSRLWQFARARVKDPAFGLKVARQLRPSSFHAMGYAMSSSVNLYRALQRFTRYCRLISDAATAILVRRGDSVVVQFYFDMGKQPPIYQSFDTVLSGLVYLLRWISGENLIPKCVSLRYGGPPLDPRFNAFFACDIKYGAALDSICFDRADLDKPILAADEEMAACFDNISNRDLDIRMEGRFTTRVRDALVAQFANGAPSRLHTANMLNFTERTLLRRLKEEGVTYSSVLNQLREELAYQYIQGGDISMLQISERLGFSDYGSFSRAFARWTGTRPSEVGKSRGN